MYVSLNTKSAHSIHYRLHICKYSIHVHNRGFCSLWLLCGIDVYALKKCELKT